MSPRPISVRLRAYNVGFGDCLLLTVRYSATLPDGRDVRHMLVDCGTKKGAKGGVSMAELGPLLKEACDPKLDVLVATHRHADHISGFGVQAVQDAIDALAPTKVVRPWPDAPEAHIEGKQSKNFALAVAGLSTFASSVQADLDRQLAARPLGKSGRAAAPTAQEARAKVLADLGIHNPEAVSRLEGWADGDGLWVKHGDQLELDDVMPQVKVQVLGPPTIEQVPNLTSEADDSADYWLQLAIASGDPAAAAAADALGGLTSPTRNDRLQKALATLAGPDGVGAASWLLGRLNDREIRQVLGIVQAFDGMLNNTSVILLVEVAGKRILLSGDAQIENWSWCLRQILTKEDDPNLDNEATADPELRDQLRDLHLYKVGHHGSRNATPRRLHKLWKERPEGTPGLVSVVSTLSGFYEKSTEGAVPKTKLLTELGKLGELHSTEHIDGGGRWIDLVCSDQPGATFELAT